MSSRYRDDARQRVQTPRQVDAGYAATLAWRTGRRLRCSVIACAARTCASGPTALLPGPHTTHFVRDPSVIYSGRTGYPETLCWK